MNKEQVLALLEVMRECRDELDSTLYTNIHDTAGVVKVRDLMLRIYKAEQSLREDFNIPAE